MVELFLTQNDDKIDKILHKMNTHNLTRKRIESAPNLKMAITAGIGSDHVDLQAAMDNKVDVVEVTYCNSRSVAEHIAVSYTHLTLPTKA